MLNIAVCDDENKICDLYSNKLQVILNTEQISAKISCYCNSKHFFENLPNTRYDIVFLDIDMPEITGLQIAKEMLSFANKPLLVFVTNQDALVYQSFQYHPFSFIRKNYFNEEIERVLLSAIQELLKKDYRYVFRYESELMSLALSEILYFEACGNYLNIYTHNNSYRCRETMANMEKEISERGFIRIHKGFLLNQEAVFRIGRDEVSLMDGTVLPIGRSNKDAVKQKLMRYLIR